MNLQPQARGATQLTMPQKAIAVLMSIVLAVGLCPIAKPATQAWADSAAGESSALKAQAVSQSMYTDASSVANTYNSTHYNKHSNGQNIDAADADYVKVLEGVSSANSITLTTSELNNVTYQASDTFKLSVGMNATVTFNYFKIIDNNLCVAFPVVLFDMLESGTIKVDSGDAQAFSGNSGGTASVTAVRGQKPSDSAISVAGGGNNTYTVTHSSTKPSTEWIEVAIDGLSDDDAMMITKKVFTDASRQKSTSYGFTKPDTSAYGDKPKVLGFYGFGWNTTAVPLSADNCSYDYQVYLVSTGKTAHITLNLKVEPFVTFVNGDSKSQVRVEKGQTVDKPADPQKEGAAFAGWFTDENCTIRYDFKTSVNSNLTLYAKWIDVSNPSTAEAVGSKLAAAKAYVYTGENARQYVGRFATSGTKVYYAIDSNQVANEDGKAVLNDLARLVGALHRVASPATTIEYDGKVYAWDDGLKLKGSNWRWVASDYWGVDASGGNVTAYDTLAGAITAKQFKSDGNIDKTISLKVDGVDVSIQLMKDAHLVTFESNGGSAVDAQLVAKAEKATAPTAPTKEGSAFAGWYSDELLTAEHDFDTAIANDVALYAKWTPTPTPTPTVDADKVKAVQKAIDALPEESAVGLGDKEAVKAAKAAYDALNSAERARVKTDKLTAALTKLETLDEEAAKPVQDAIDALSDSSSEADVRAAKAAYDKLDADQKKLVNSEQLDKLNAAVAKADEAAAAKVAADKAAADAAVALIGAASASDPATVEAARAAYDALTVDQKALVGADNLKKLTDAEAQVKADREAAESAAAKAAADKAAADTVSALLEKMDAGSAAEVASARAAYDALTADQKALVGAATLKKLTDAEAALANPKTNAEVDDVALPSGTTVDVKVTSPSAKSVTVTGSEAKSGDSVTVNTVQIEGTTYKVTAIAANAFKGTKAAKVTVGSNVKTIGASAFANASNLTSATIGNNVTKLGAKAFYGDKKLKSLTVGKKVKTVGKNPLAGCTKLTKVTLKSSKLTKSSLKNLVKGSKVKTIKLKGVSKKAKAKYKKWAPKGVKVK